MSSPLGRRALRTSSLRTRPLRPQAENVRREAKITRRLGTSTSSRLVMAPDDLDDLLDEVESTFFKAAPPKENKLRPTSKQANFPRPSSQHPKREEDDLSAMIHDICSDDGLVLPDKLKEPARANTKTNQPASASSQKRRCFKLLLGGSRFSKGLCTGSEQRTCDKLRCTSCDFNVVMYDDFEWQQDCDYLFFRNNVPDFQKLKNKLISRKGCRAYACQCLWRSVADLTDVLADQPLKWVCGKHS